MVGIVVSLLYFCSSSMLAGTKGFRDAARPTFG